MMDSKEKNARHGVEVLVFKTNATKDLDTTVVVELLQEVEGLADWNFDLEDCDGIFRAVSIGIKPWQMIEILEKIGIQAIELTD